MHGQLIKCNKLTNLNEIKLNISNFLNHQLRHKKCVKEQEKRETVGNKKKSRPLKTLDSESWRI